MADRRFEGARSVVLGGGGFVGSHLCDLLVAEGASVVCVDSFVTGRRENVSSAAIKVVDADVTQAFEVSGPLDYVFHLASPASPVDFERWPIEILEVGSRGTSNALELAEAHKAVFVLASTSEVYGDPLIHPQTETYRGNVNPVGVRSAYDEGKRFAEAMTMAHHRVRGVDTRIARIFNTYGPRMRPDDGRAVPAFFTAALRREPLPVHGDGSQTRSLCYVSDLVEGLARLAVSAVTEPVNLGNPREVTILELATMIQEVTGESPGVELGPRPPDDPSVRCPDISRARELLGWEPLVDLEDGLRRTLPWFRRQMTR